MKDKITLGQFLSGDEHRDAIHIAIAPVIANEKLYPGQAIGFVVDGDIERVGDCANCIGIVDPFLTKPVVPDQKFWMMLYPNTITSLRHEWVHPAFAITDKDKTVASKEWLAMFAQSLGMDYEELIDAAKRYATYGDYLIQGGRFEGVSTPRGFWDHYENATGETVCDDDRGSFFSCSC